MGDTNMERMIIFGSQYGTARQYAQELSRQTGIPAISYKEAGNADRYQTIVYIGSLYAGGVLGMQKTLKNVHATADKQIFIVTVGLADPEDVKNIQNIRQNIKKQLPKEIFEQAELFHLRGGIDYAKLGFKHKAMMAMLYQKIKSLPEEQKTAEIRAMIDTYNKQVSFVDFGTLDALTRQLNK